MKHLIVLLFLVGGLSACGPDASFNPDEIRLNDLMDGETVELVNDDDVSDPDRVFESDDVFTNEERQETESEAEEVAHNDDNKNHLDKEGKKSEESSKDDEKIVDGDHSRDKSDDDPSSQSDNKRGKRCIARLLDKEKKKKYHQMYASPDESNTKEIKKYVHCGSKAKKIAVCHFPNDDHSKRKTLCVGKAALKALVSSRKSSNFLGRCRY